MVPFEALYGRYCHSPICFETVHEGKTLELESVQKKYQSNKRMIRTIQSSQKCYSDNPRRDLGFDMGDFVFLKISP